MFDRERIVYHRGGLVFALCDGAYAHIEDVPNGLACGCICEECQGTLIARNRGEILAPHFAHAAGEKCTNTGDAGLTRAVASILSETRRLLIPAMAVGEVVLGGREITIDAAEAITVRGRTPEVRVTAGKRILRLFVRPSTRTPPKVKEDVTQQGVSAMQLEITPRSDGTITAGDLIDGLIDWRRNRSWLLNTRVAALATVPTSRLSVPPKAAPGPEKVMPRAPRPAPSAPSAPRLARGEPGLRFCWKCGTIRMFARRDNALQCESCGVVFLGDG